MKKNIVKAGLRMIPRSIQTKALCKAVNYLVPKDQSPFELDFVIKLNVHDLNKVWFISQGTEGFQPSKIEFEDLEIRADFESILACSEKDNINYFLNTGSFLILGDEKVVSQSISLVSNISQEKINGIQSHFFNFLRLSKQTKNIQQPENLPFDINTVTLEDLKTQEHIDFVRDQALRLEQDDLDMAIKLMGLAHKARPEGPFIKQKLEEYKSKRS